MLRLISLSLSLSFSLSFTCTYVKGRDVIKAVVALHTWDGGLFTSVPSPLMIVSSSEDSNAPYRDTKRVYDRATGPKIIGVLEGSNHYTSPRFWAGLMTAFFRTHLAGDAEAEKYVWGRAVPFTHHPIHP